MRDYGRDDDEGLFWEKTGRFAVARKNPTRLEVQRVISIPETGWQLPSDYPSLKGQGPIAIDVETYDPDIQTKGPGAYRDGKIVGLAIGTAAGFRRYYPIGHEVGPNLPSDNVLDYARRELRSDVAKVGANLFYDLAFLGAAGVEVRGPYHDIQIAEPLIDENRLSFSLDEISFSYLREGKVTNVMKQWLIDSYGEHNYKFNIYRAPTVVAGPYAEGDVDLPLRIFAKQEPILRERGLWPVFEMESRLIPMLLAMWKRGVPVDLDAAEKLRDDLIRRQATILKKIKHASGQDCNIWAADSIAKICDANQPKKIIYSKTPTGKPSFRKEWLNQRPEPVMKLIAEARRLDKFRGTFLEGYILEGNINGIIHCTFHQLRSDAGGTVSGRLSSSNPNLQNIPIRDPELGPLIRAMFIALYGCRWWKFDWSQIEFRLAAHHAARHNLPGADKVIEQYLNDPTTDYHKVVAALTGLPRSSAKNLNFGILYGEGLAKICYTLGVKTREGQNILNGYHARVPFAKMLSNNASRWAEKTGIITMSSGRQRHFDTWEHNGVYLHSREQPENKAFQRTFLHAALNAKLQGDAADIMKTAMVRSWEEGVYNDIGPPHLTVHDELDGSADESPKALEALKHLKHIMETPPAFFKPLLVPLVAEGGTGPNWGSIK